MKKLYLQYDCFMAHCFTSDSKKGKLYKRMEDVVTNTTEFAPCCSTIKVGDKCFTNFFAPIGFIIGECNVIYCHPKDGATRREEGKLVCSDGLGIEDPSLLEVEQTIVGRQNYNEFHVTNYELKGIFIDPKHAITSLASIKHDLFQFHESTKHFGLPYYLFLTDGLDKAVIDYTKNRFAKDKDITIAELYV
jgi:hypothetical protein